MKKYILISFLMLAPIIASAQGASPSYNTGIGLRFGMDGGLTVKHFISDNAAIEGILSSYGYNGGINVTGLYELHAGAFNNSQFMWFYGAGGHVGFYGTGRRYSDRDGRRYNGSFVNIGVEGIVGLEYQIPAIPISLGLDIKPTIDLINPVYYGGYPGGAFYIGGAFTARYTF